MLQGANVSINFPDELKVNVDARPSVQDPFQHSFEALSMKRLETLTNGRSRLAYLFTAYSTNSEGNRRNLQRRCLRATLVRAYENS